MHLRVLISLAKVIICLLLATKILYFHPDKLMIGSYISSVVVACQKRKVLFFLSLIFVIVFLLFGISRIKVSENIFSAFPQAASFESLNTLLESKNLSNNVIFSIQTGTLNNDELVDLLLEFSDSLRINSESYLSDIEPIKQDINQTTYDYFYQNFPYLIDSDYYDYLSSKIRDDSITASLETSFNQLTAPGGAFSKEFLLNDPLFLTAPYFRSLNNQFTNEHFLSEDGMLFLKDKSEILITAKITFSFK